MITSWHLHYFGTVIKLLKLYPILEVVDQLSVICRYRDMGPHLPMYVSELGGQLKWESTCTCRCGRKRGSMAYIQLYSYITNTGYLPWDNIIRPHIQGCCKLLSVIDYIAIHFHGNHSLVVFKCDNIDFLMFIFPDKLVSAGKIQHNTKAGKVLL